MEYDFHGILVPIVTPFCEGRNKIDEKALRSLCRFFVKRRVNGLFAVGTAGEFPVLTKDERKQIAEVVIDEISQDIPVIIQTGSISTIETIELTKHAQRSGANAAAIVVPYYYTLDEEEIFIHYDKILKEIPSFPIFIYNVPSNTKNVVSPSLIIRLRERHQNIIGAKNSIESLNILQEYINISKDNFFTFIGNDGIILPALIMGAAGAVSGIAIVFPEICVALYEHFLGGRIAEAKEMQMNMNKLLSLFGKRRKLSKLKIALNLRGIEVGGMRQPLQNILPEERKVFLENITKLVQQLGLKIKSD